MSQQLDTATPIARTPMTETDKAHSVRAFIALGANLGEPLKQLDSAVESLNKQQGVTCIAMSKVYVSKPWGNTDQPDFTNAVLEIHTSLSAEQLLDVLQKIELEHGRERKEHWGARTLDLDIILFGDEIINTERLIVPHPRAIEREFVIQPLADLDETLAIGQHSVSDLLNTLPIETMEIIRDVTTYNN